MYQKIYLYLLMLGTAFLPTEMLAQIPTVVIASSLGSDMTISGTSLRDVTFPLTTIPAGATIESCMLQLTAAQAVASQMNLSAHLGNDNTFPEGIQNNNRRIGYLVLDAGVKKDSTFEIKVNKLFIEQNIGKNFKVTLKGGDNGSVVLTNQTPIGNCPRLLITYSLPNTATQTNWAMSQADRQHTASTYSRFAGEKPSAWAANEVKDLGDVQTDLVMYANKIYTVGYKEGKTNLYAIEPYSKNAVVVGENLPVHSKQAMPAINGNGVFYYFTANAAHCIELANSNKKTENVITYSSIEAPIASPTIGQDGALYLVMTNNVYAYSPFPEHKQLWLYSLAGKKSPVTLNKAGTIAYFVSYETNTIFAVNTSNGKQIASATIAGLTNVENEGATIPLVDNAGNVYVSNKLINASKIAIFDEKLKPIRTVEGTNMSRPVMGAGDFVFWVNNGILTKATADKDNSTSTLSSGLSVHSIVADASNNVYCLGKNRVLYTYIDVTNNYSVGTIDYQKAMIIAPDGVLYTATNSLVYKFSPSTYTGNYTVTATDIQNNNTVFRGTTLNIPTNINVDKTQTFVGGKLVVTANGTSSPTFNTKANVSLIGNTGISFQPGFHVKQGATLACKVGN